MNIYRTPLNIANALWFHEVTTWQLSAPLSPPLTHLTYKMSNVVYLPNVQADSELKKGRYNFPQL